MSKARVPCLAFILVLSACGAESGPAETYRSYLAALSAGDLERAYDLLAESSRKRLAAAEGSTAGEGDGSPAGFEFFRTRVAGPHGEDYPPLPEDTASLVESVEEDGDLALVRVRTPLGPREARMVRENGVWRVDLSF